MSKEDKRRINEKKFTSSENLPGEGRKYLLEIKGRHGWKAKYVKEVDANEKTIKFFQKFMMTREI